MRIVYLAGPGNVWDVIERLDRGEADEVTSHAAYSEQLYRAAMDVGAELLILTTHPGRESFTGERVTVERFDDDFANKGGLGFHLASFEMARQLRARVARFDPHVLFLGDDPPRLWATEWMRGRGVALLRAHHCKLQRHPDRRRFTDRVLFGLDRPIARQRVDAFLSVSREVTRDIEAVYGRGAAPIVEFIPRYEAGAYAAVPPPDLDAEVLRIVFIGRVEEEKGAFDLLEAAERLRHRSDVAFDVCGVGGALEGLRARARDAGLEDRFVLHGWCDKPALERVLGASHLGVVPTRTSFNEGFNKACVEMLLAGRPVVTSRAVPALRYLGAACEEAEPDTPSSYAAAFERVLDDRDRYRRLQAACAAEVTKFSDPRASYRTALDRVFAAFRDGRPVRARRVGFDGRVRDP